MAGKLGGPEAGVGGRGALGQGRTRGAVGLRRVAETGRQGFQPNLDHSVRPRRPELGEDRAHEWVGVDRALGQVLALQLREGQQGVDQLVPCSGPNGG
jgi:hypothetical protein